MGLMVLIAVIIFVGIAGAFGGVIGGLLACILLGVAIIAITVLCVSQGRKVI